MCRSVGKHTMILSFLFDVARPHKKTFSFCFGLFAIWLAIPLNNAQISVAVFSYRDSMKSDSVTRFGRVACLYECVQLVTSFERTHSHITTVFWLLHVEKYADFYFYANTSYIQWELFCYKMVAGQQFHTNPIEVSLTRHREKKSEHTVNFNKNETCSIYHPLAYSATFLYRS